MAAPGSGPQYCETPLIDTGFPVEPANTWSSGVIVLYGIAALVLVMRRQPRDLWLYALCALLIVNGTGSILWHGLRTRWALTLDVLPALVFVLAAAFLWARRVMPLWQAIVLGLALVILPLAFLRLGFGLLPAFRIVTTAGIIAAAGVFLVVRTMSVSPRIALIGGLALVSAVTALAARTLDANACAVVPFGSHFLWHIFLSTAAFLCVLTLVRLNESVPASTSR